MGNRDYQNYRFKISLRQGLYWICPSWGFDSRSPSLFKVQTLRTKYEVKKRTYQHWPIPKRSEQKCPGAPSRPVKNPGASRGLIIAQPPAWAPQQLPWAARSSEKGSTGAPWSTNISNSISWFIFKRHAEDSLEPPGVICKATVSPPPISCIDSDRDLK